MPEKGRQAAQLLEEASTLLFDHSLFNGHPRFWGYITSPAAPIGMLGDLLASAVNPNVGAFTLSPVATEIEKQTIFNALAQTNGDKMLAARLLGIGKTTLYRKLKEYETEA
jgi:transcriptional regulator of acetoin/glycerol metabolism